MKKTLITLALIASTFTTQAFAESAPMDISVETLPAQHNIKVTALANNLKVTGIVMNRGNCDVKLAQTRLQLIQNKPRPRYPVALNYGQSTNAYALTYQCDVREITVQSNQGDWTWTFN